MKRAGFTMIELIFVIVILGILAAVAVPKLAATRDDAKNTSIKAQVATALSAVPAYYTGQKINSFSGAMSLDSSNWVAVGTDGCGVIFTDSVGDTITMAIVEDANASPSACSATVVNNTDDNLSLTVAFDLSAAGDSTVQAVSDMGLSATTVSMGGRKVLR